MLVVGLDDETILQSLFAERSEEICRSDDGELHDLLLHVLGNVEFALFRHSICKDRRQVKDWFVAIPIDDVGTIQIRTGTVRLLSLTLLTFKHFLDACKLRNALLIDDIFQRVEDVILTGQLLTERENSILTLFALIDLESLVRQLRTNPTTQVLVLR